MASCDTTVLTGQEGLIQFKPLGTTNCVDDFCPFGGELADGTATPERVYLPCSADYTVGECITIEPIRIPEDEGQSADGGTSVIEDGDQFWIVDTGTGASGDLDACGNDMGGIPYVELSLTENGNAINWDGDEAGEVLSTGTLEAKAYTPTAGGDGYTNGTHTDVELVTTGGGTGATATVVVLGGSITAFTIETGNGGQNYSAGDVVQFELENGNGTDATYTLLAADLETVRTDSPNGHYVFRLCEFQTVCGVRSFSIDLSRDELDVTTLPCSVSESCGKELASFRKTQAGFATATGTLEVYFTCDQASIQNKILQGSLQRTQGGASVRLFVCTKTDADGNIIEDDSLYIEADIQLLGMSFSVNPDDPTTATINFGVTSVQSAFGLS